MKKILLFLICSFFALQACAPKNTNQNNEENADNIELNKETTIDEETMMVGKVDRSGFQMSEYKSWFDFHYEDYQLKDSVLSKFGNELSEVDITIILGTWCSDTQRDIPAFYKILDSLNVAPKSLTMIATDRTKKIPEEDMKDFDITYVPNYFFYRDGEQIGRIIELPERSLEEDMLAIITAIDE